MRPRTAGLIEALGLLVLAYGLQIAFSWSFSATALVKDTLLVAGFSNLFALTAVAVLGFWLIGRRLPSATPGFSWTLRPVAAMLLTVLGGSIVLGELSNRLTAVFPLPESLAQLFRLLASGQPWVVLFAVAFVAPLTEELLFRGFLLTNFVDRYGRVPGLILSSLLFGLFHLNLWQGIPAFLAGLYLGKVYLETRTLAGPILLHALFNVLPVCLSLAGIQWEGFNSEPRAGVAEYQPWPLVAGGSVLLAVGLALSTRWSPLSRIEASDTLAP